MAESVDATDLKSVSRKGVPVRPGPGAPIASGTRGELSSRSRSSRCGASRRAITWNSRNGPFDRRFAADFEKRFIIIGSQSLHGKHADLADDIVRSAEVDLIAKRDASCTEWLNAIGQDSELHEQFGYYADPVDETTAILPKGWKSRLVNLPAGDTDGVAGLCLDPHDLAIAKYAAGREKDVVFTRELVSRGIVSNDRLLALLDQTPVSEATHRRIRAQIARDFAAARERRK